MLLLFAIFFNFFCIDLDFYLFSIIFILHDQFNLDLLEVPQMNMKGYHVETAGCLFIYAYYSFCCSYLDNLGTFISVQLLSNIWLFATPCSAACQASLSVTNTWSLLKLMSIESLMPSTISSSVVPFSSHLQKTQHQGLFKWVSSSHQVVKVLEFQLQHWSFQWILRVDFL